MQCFLSTRELLHLDGDTRSIPTLGDVTVAMTTGLVFRNLAVFALGLGRTQYVRSAERRVI